MTDATLPTVPRQQPHYSASLDPALTVELAKMLVLVAPTSMTSDQQELFLRAAVDALEDIRADDVRVVSAEVRRSITRPNQIVPEIARLVAEKRGRASKQTALGPALLPPPERRPGPPLSATEIAKLPAWLKSMGLRVGFLKRVGDRLVDAAA